MMQKNCVLVSAKMINEEQKELADYVKQVHLSLRRKTKEIGAEKAWEEHLNNEEVLSKYAFSMKKLAEEFWSINNRTRASEFLCRIQWIINYILNYFQKGLIQTELDKEIKKMERFHERKLIDEEEFALYVEKELQYHSRLKLLDVGSCYNPFRKFDFLDVYPIDLYPASQDVKTCNFIETKIMNITGQWFQDKVTQIPCNFFHVVVFSLFLEYLPSPKQRYVACLNAYNCLKSNGVLLIVTPDSKHASANANLMKRWKIAAAKMGFVRTKLEKLKYLYCMAFRKAVSRKYPLLLHNINTSEISPEEMFPIPQDSVNYKSEEKSSGRNDGIKPDLKLFEELPFVDNVDSVQSVEPD